jgi:hypothetical protein
MMINKQAATQSVVACFSFFQQVQLINDQPAESDTLLLDYSLCGKPVALKCPYHIYSV